MKTQNINMIVKLLEGTGSNKWGKE